MRASIFIPCVPSHFLNVEKIIDFYLNGSEKPDEIICFLSDSSKVDSNYVNQVQKKFENILKIICVNEKVYAGPARQAAYDLCNADIILYQDADDLPHNRRVEIIKQYFEKYSEIMLINHSYVRFKDTFSEMNEIEMPIKETNGSELYDFYFPNKILEDCVKSSLCFGGGVQWSVHAGAVCIRKRVLEKIQWKGPENLLFAPDPKTKTEDYEFNMEALYYLNSHLIINAKLYFYNHPNP